MLDDTSKYEEFSLAAVEDSSLRCSPRLYYRHFSLITIKEQQNGVVEVLCRMDLKYKKYVRADKKITVRLKKALYGCIQSALLWHKELSSTIISLGFQSDPYDTCSFTRKRADSIDTILVYVDDLFITLDAEGVLFDIAAALKLKYGAVTSHTGLHNGFLGIH